jgi:4'-phosphopantetheinyl transferase
MMPNAVLLRLDITAGELPRMWEILDPDERTQADRFLFASDRTRFVARRGLLRLLLARTLNRDPKALRYGSTGHGKPFLREAPHLQFSLSHSGDLALCAMANAARIGCDIERLDPKLASRETAATMFSTAENRSLMTLPASDFVEGFFNCWTRKEAFVKGIGVGLSYPLKAFDVSTTPGEDARFLSGASGWSLSSFDPIIGYRAAIALNGVIADVPIPLELFSA